MTTRSVLSVLFLCAIGCADQQEDGSSAPATVQEDGPTTEPMVVDFGAGAESSWFAVNDTVMGGESEGAVEYSEDSLIFEGVVSTQSNGGFTSVRSPTSSWNLSKFDTVVIRLRSAGQPFTMVLADSPNWWEGQFRYDIRTADERWTEVEIPLSDFEFHSFNSGYPEPTGAMMRRPDRKALVHIELMSELFVDGEFRLEVDEISFNTL